MRICERVFVPAHVRDYERALECVFIIRGQCCPKRMHMETNEMVSIAINSVAVKKAIQ